MPACRGAGRFRGEAPASSRLNVEVSRAVQQQEGKGGSFSPRPAPGPAASWPVQPDAPPALPPTTPCPHTHLRQAPEVELLVGLHVLLAPAAVPAVLGVQLLRLEEGLRRGGAGRWGVVGEGRGQWAAAVLCSVVWCYGEVGSCGAAAARQEAACGHMLPCRAAGQRGKRQAQWGQAPAAPPFLSPPVPTRQAAPP